MPSEQTCFRDTSQYSDLTESYFGPSFPGFENFETYESFETFEASEIF